MTSLPRALMHAPHDQPVPSGGLVATGAAFAAGNFLLVESGREKLAALRLAIAGGCRGIALVGCRSGADIQRLAVLLDVAEAEEGVADGAVRILGVTDGIMPAPRDTSGFSGKTPRLAGLVWDHHALARCLGAKRHETAPGTWTTPFAAARAAVLLAAGAAGVPAYDSAEPHASGLFSEISQRSRDDGFYGCLAATTAQMAIIEEIYAGD